MLVQQGHTSPAPCSAGLLLLREKQASLLSEPLCCRQLTWVGPIKQETLAVVQAPWEGTGLPGR